MPTTTSALTPPGSQRFIKQGASMQRVLGIIALLLCTTPLHAQSNVAYGNAGQSSTDSGNANDPFFTQFKTGLSTGGYTVNNIHVWTGSPGTSSLQVAIYPDNGSNNPGTAATCTGSTVTPTSGFASYSISGCGTLAANTLYWIAFNQNSNTQQQGFTSGACPQTGLATGFMNGMTFGTWGNPGTITATSNCYSAYVSLSPTSTGPSFANKVANIQCSGTTTCNMTTTVPLTSGEVVVATVYADQNVTITASDDAGSTYSTLSSILFDGTARFAKEFCVAFAKPDANVKFTGTVGSAIQMYMTLRVYTQATCTVDGTPQTADQTSTTPVTGSFTTSSQPDVLLCDASNVTTPSSVTAGSGYAIRQTFGSGASVNLASADQGGAAGVNAGSYTCGFTFGSSVETGLIGLAIKGSNASGAAKTMPAAVY